MERIVEGEVTKLASRDGVPPLARELQGRLPGLGAAVTEKGAVGERILHQHLRQLHRRNGVVEIGDVHQFGGLFLNGLEHVVVAITQGIDRQAADEVEVAVAIGVEEVDPVAPFEYELGPTVGLQDILLFAFDNVFGFHAFLRPTGQSGCRYLL